MPATILHIKNMVCNRCIKVVNDELSGMGYTIKNIELGEVALKEKLTENDLEKITQVLTENGFELIDDRKSKIINRIRTLIIEFIHYNKEKPEQMNLSDFLAKEISALSCTKLVIRGAHLKEAF
ncbi:MAG: hypothetical protein ABFS38_21995 [Bacteroidota bacterium]